MMYCNQKTEVKSENATVAKFSDADGHTGRFRRLGVKCHALFLIFEGHFHLFLEFIDYTKLKLIYLIIFIASK
jgi:fructose-1,6-bisphosphatase/inositol monophosphatase family enzyme